MQYFPSAVNQSIVKWHMPVFCFKIHATWKCIIITLEWWIYRQIDELIGLET